MQQDVIEVKTRSGFEWKLEADVTDDQELLDALVEVQKTRIYKPVIDIMLGEEGRKALYNHVRNEKGKVPASKIMLEVADIFNCIRENKQVKNS